MRCTKCGREMRIGSEEYCKDANGNPMYKNFAYCGTCRIKSELQDMNYMHSNYFLISYRSFINNDRRNRTFASSQK